MLLFADSLSGGQLIVVGALLVGVAFVLRRTAVGGKRPRIRDPLREVHEEFRQAESTYSAQLNQMEVRLHDFSREVEGRVETRLAFLDQLVLDADREIERLESLLAETDAKRAGSVLPRHSALDIVIPPLTAAPHAADREIERLEHLLALPEGSLAGPTLAPDSGPDIIISQSPADVRKQAPASFAKTAIRADLQRSIYALYDAGFSPHEISEALGQPVSRIVLLLGLRPASDQADAA